MLNKFGVSSEEYRNEFKKFRALCKKRKDVISMLGLAAPSTI